MLRECKITAFVHVNVSGLTLATIVFGFLRSLLVFHVLVSAAQALHNLMFKSLLRAPVLFFDRNPIGKFV